MSPYVATRIVVVLRDGRRLDVTGQPIDAIKRRLRSLRVPRKDIKAIERTVRDDPETR